MKILAIIAVVALIGAFIMSYLNWKKRRDIINKMFGGDEE